MANKSITYKEPSDYFSANMRKAVKAYDQKQAKTQTAKSQAATKKDKK